MAHEKETYQNDVAPAEMTQVVEPVTIKPAGAGETVILEPIENNKPTETTEQKTPKAKKRHRVLIGALVSLVVILGAVAALEFIPGSPLEYTIRSLFASTETVQANPINKADLPSQKAEEHCRALDLRLVFMVPESALPAIPEESVSEAVGEGSAEAPETTDDATPEPSAAERYIEELQGAADALNACTASTTSIKLSVKPVEYVDPGTSEASAVYRTPAKVQRMAKAAEETRAAAMAEAVVTIPAAAMLSCICYDPGIFEISLVAPIVDERGFVWVAETESIRVELLEDTEVEFVLVPVDFTAISDEEFAKYRTSAGKYAEALDRMRALALEAVAEPVAGEDPEDGDDEPEGSEGTDNPGGQGGAGGGGSSTPGGNSGSQGSSGSQGGNGSGSGNGSSNGSGSGSGGGETTHTHTLATRDVYVGTEDVTIVDVPGHYETVHHDAVYNDWTEYIDRCSVCKEDITADPTAHMKSTGHDGYYLDTIPHHDLVSGAYDSEEWIPEQSHTVTYAMYVTETYCVVCGEVTATSSPWHY